MQEKGGGMWAEGGSGHRLQIRKIVDHKMAKDK